MSVDGTILQRLIEAPWRRIWAQGGRIRSYSCHPPGIYSEVITIESVSGLFEIDNLPVNVAGGGEEFEIEVSILDEIGTAQSECLFAPCRKIVNHFPNDLSIGEFLDRPGIIARLFTDKLDERCQSAHRAVLFTAGNKSIVFSVDREIPESVAIASDSRLISRLLHGLVECKTNAHYK